MIEEIKKKISDDNAVLEILPQNNVSNRKKYVAKLTELSREYRMLQKDIYNYITAKNSVLKNKYSVGFDENSQEETKELEEKLKYFNNYQDPYEILGLDILFYNLHKYYNNDLNFYNDNINKILDVFEKAGIFLTQKDFYFTESANLYMGVILDERKAYNKNPALLKESFENLFWKSHNMMRFILLNFKHLYYKNEKKFKEHIRNMQKEILYEYGDSYDNLLHKYQELIVRRNNIFLTSKGVFYDMFVSKEIATKDFEDEKIQKLIDEFLESGYNPIDKKDFFMKFYASIKEEMFIFEYKFILDAVDKLFKEKDSFKNLVSTSMKEINSLEKNILKKWKRMHSNCIFARHDKNGIINSEIENILLELDGKYDLLDENRYKEKIASMVNPTIKDYYLLGKSYLFLRNYTKEMEDIDLNEVIKKIFNNLYSPYNAVIENINYSDLDNLNLIIYDKYRLIGFNLKSDDLISDNLENLVKTIGTIIIYFSLNNLEFKLDEVDFILNSDEIIKKMSDS